MALEYVLDVFARLLLLSIKLTVLVCSMDSHSLDCCQGSSVSAELEFQKQMGTLVTRVDSMEQGRHLSEPIRQLRTDLSSVTSKVSVLETSVREAGNSKGAGLTAEFQKQVRAVVRRMDVLEQTKSADASSGELQTEVNTRLNALELEAGEVASIQHQLDMSTKRVALLEQTSSQKQQQVMSLALSCPLSLTFDMLLTTQSY